MSESQSTRQPLAGFDWLVLSVVGLTPLAFGFFDLLPPEIWSHHPFHAVVEGLGSFAAVIVAAAMVMLMQQGDLPRAYIWVICGLIGMGMLDGFHAATHAGHVFVWLHSTATFVGGVLFAAIWLPDKINQRIDTFVVAMLTFAVVTIFGAGSILAPHWLPEMKNDQGFTFMAKALNVGGGIGFLAATVYFLVKQGKSHDSILFANLSLLFGVAGIIFERSVLWDSNWWLWHILRLAAYGVVLYYFMAMYYRTLLNLHVAHTSLQQKIDDVSQQKAETQRAREQLETILDSTADAIVSVDANAKIRLFNSRAESLFGYDREQVLGQRVSTLFTPTAREEHDRLLQGFRNGASAAGQEHQLQAIQANGDSFPVALRITEMQYGDEKLFIELMQDVTTRQRAEEERRQLFEAISDTVTNLSTASEEIAATMAAQTEGAARQADVVTNTMNAVEETAGVANESAEIATAVAETARRADDVGRSGREALEDTRQSMNTLQSHVESTAVNILTLADRAQAIGEIITAVNDIAEQTNVLALNAAVEASRAGEAGRGFAVVASEVKSLAEQAKKATQQVRNILSEIQQATTNAVVSTENGTKSVDAANRVVANAEKTIEELGTMVSSAAQLAAQIVSASSRQSASMSRITDSMNEIDGAAQRTRAATRQTMQSAADLDSLGKKLNSMIEGEVRG